MGTALPAVVLDEGLTGRVQPGSGDKILWLHGYTVDARMWLDFWRRLPDWYHVGVDLPGHGGSVPVTDMGDLPTLGRRLGRLCQRQNIRHLVASSVGTITATQIAIEFPSWFSSVVLSAPSLAGGPQEAEIAQVYTKLFQLYALSGAGPQMRDVWMACRVWDGIDRVPGLRQRLATLVDQHSWAEMKGFAMRLYMTHPQPEAALRSIQAPVLIMIGERELPAFREVAGTLTRVLPRSRLLEIPDADHLCMVQYPDAAARAIESHLRAHASHLPGNRA